MVIPTRNEESIIRKRLVNIEAMSYPPEKLEVIFVDSSSDETSALIAEFARDHPYIKLVKQTRPGFNSALNLGYGLAKGEIVVKSDCDAFPEQGALRELVSNFADKSVGVVSGIHVITDSSKTEKQFRGIQTRILLFQSYLHSTFIAHGAFSGYLSKIIPKLPEEVTADDSIVVMEAVKRGLRAIIDHRVKVQEFYPEDFALRREMKDRRAAGVVRVMFQNLEVLLNPKFGMFGLVCFPVSFLVLVVGPLLATALAILILIYGILCEPLALVLILVPVLLYLVSFVNDDRVTTLTKTVFDFYFSSIAGIAGAAKRRPTWKRSEGQRGQPC
jgi:cellulose synthase/poly-beta-1,6-N-acetylglucosamine synthase-like glycosyltransferase